MLTLLVEAALRTIALGIIVGLAFASLRRRGIKSSGRAELTAWTLVLGASLAMPFLMRWSPDMIVPVPQPVVELTQAPAVLDVMAPANDGPVMQFTDYRDNGSHSLAWAWHDIAAAAYLAVAGFLLLRLVSGLILSARLRRDAEPLPDSALYGLDIRMSDRIAAPMAVASTILVPPDYPTWPAIKRQAVLAHESAHVARGDFHVLVASCINRAVFWFSPLAWWLHDRLAQLAEDASDAAAIDTVSEPVAYAEVLFEFAQRNTPAAEGRKPKFAFAIAMARPNTVAGRIEKILSGQPLSRRIPMRKHLLVFASLLPLVTVTAGLQFTAVREAVAASTPGQQRTVPAFHAVSFSPSGTLNISVGGAQSLSLEADPELLARVTTEVRDGTLYIGRKNEYGRNDHGDVTVHIAMPKLDSVKVSGSAAIAIDGLKGGTTEVGISGSGSLKAKGTLDKLDLDISGSGKADIPDLTVDEAFVKISGSGNVKINATKVLEAKISGSGDVRYLGSPRVTSRVSGSGSIDRVN